MRRKTYNLGRRLRDFHSYTTKQLAEKLGVHVRTVQGWKKKGLLPIDSEAAHPLFRGLIVKNFLRAIRKSTHVNLQGAQFYCPRCRGPRKSLRDCLSIRLIGNQPLAPANRCIVVGTCSQCGCGLNYFTSIRKLKLSEFYANLSEDQRRMIESTQPSPNTDKEL